MPKPKPDPFTLGGRLRMARMMRGMERGELAGAAGISASEVSLYENNRREPRVEKLRTLCVALECSSDYLLALSDEVRK